MTQFLSSLSGLPSLLTPALFAGVALICTLAPNPGFLTQSPTQDTALWQWSAALLWLMAANSLVQGDIMFVTWVRELAHQGGWYEHRRQGQLPMLLALMAVIICMVVVLQKRRSLGQRRHATHTCPSVRWGMAILLGVLAMRFVSLHQTDALLNARLAGLSMGRWLEAAGLLLVGSAALRHRWHLHAMRE